jgi:hypothetical protein
VSLNSMSRRLSLEIPGIADAYARILLNEALGHIEDEGMWSFQLAESNWLTPGLLFNSGPGAPGQSAGTVTFTVGSNQIIGNTAASAAWAAYVGPPFLTSCQIRSPYYSLYNIIAYDTTSNPPFGTFTIDRPWMEPGGTGKAYMVYQAYFAVPVSNFRRFIAARDTTNNAPMDFWSKTQKDLSFQDPERTIFDEPVYFVPYETDQRPGSATLGNMLYELWPHPLSVLPYTFAYLSRGPSLTAPGDMVPYPITEDMVLWQAKSSAYLWKEAQKGENVERGSGADYKFLAQAAQAKYELKKKEISHRDRDLVDLYITKWRPDYYNNAEPFATVSSQLNVGRF